MLILHTRPVNSSYCWYAQVAQVEPRTGNYSGLYITDPLRKTVLNAWMNGWNNPGLIHKTVHTWLPTKQGLECNGYMHKSFIMTVWRSTQTKERSYIRGMTQLHTWVPVSIRILHRSCVLSVDCPDEPQRQKCTFIGWLVGWLIGWLIDWFVDWLVAGASTMPWTFHWKMA